MFRLLRSSAFRLTLLYMVTFGASVTGLLLFIYTAIIDDVREDLKRAISVQLFDLRRNFMLSGEQELAVSIRHVVEKDEDKAIILMLIDRNWHVLAGNLERWPGGKTNVSSDINHWITFPLGKGSLHAGNYEGYGAPFVIAMNATLPGGYILLVGRKMDRMQHVHAIVTEVLYICFGIMFLLAAAGGMLLSYTIHRRIEIFNQAFRNVAAGDLATRIRVDGTGDEFDRLGFHLNQTLARLNELIEGVRDISYNVAHDLRTPLTRLRHRIEHMVAKLAPEHHEMSEEARRCLVDIDGLVATFNAILRIAQAESGASLSQFARFDFSAAVLDVTELYRPVAEEKQQTLEAHVASDITLHGDRHLLTQMSANLLDNAIKYTPPHGHIMVTLAQDAGHATLSICDTGIGIPPEFHHKVTEKFFRLEQSRSSPGNGLGLSLVTAAVKLHQGSLLFDNNAPGLIARITLPSV